MNASCLYRFIGHPLAINSFRHWMRLLETCGGIDRGRQARAAHVTALSPLLAPLRAVEQLMYGKRVENTPIAQPPVFIIGHWRTGTTHLHNLLACDPRFAFVSTFQTLAPAAFLAGYATLRPLVARCVPSKRQADNMALSVDLPQEEEFAMCNISLHSFYLGWYFPRKMPELFRKYVLFDGVSDQDFAQWQHAYLGILKKAAFRGGGKRLILKNPVNTGRVKAILRLFPDAKFIHIYRDPYVVFKSTQLLHRTTLDMVSFQQIGDLDIERNVLEFYREMMTQFLGDKTLIPRGNLAEVRYDDLEQRPIEELGSVYDKLGLGGWAAARTPIEAYLDSCAGYKKNRFQITERDAAKVEEHWAFAIDTWGYSRPHTDSCVERRAT